jgi:hypothetical protein
MRNEGAYCNKRHTGVAGQRLLLDGRGRARLVHAPRMWARERRRRMRLSALGVGMVSHRATTTTKIAYLEEFRSRYLLHVVLGQPQGPWLCPEPLDDEPNVVEWLREGTDVLIDLAEGFEVGTVLERRDDRLNVRAIMGQIAS